MPGQTATSVGRWSFIFRHHSPLAAHSRSACGRYERYVIATPTRQLTTKTTYSRDTSALAPHRHNLATGWVNWNRYGDR